MGTSCTPDYVMLSKGASQKTTVQKHCQSITLVPVLLLNITDPHHEVIFCNHSNKVGVNKDRSMHMGHIRLMAGKVYMSDSPLKSGIIVTFTVEHNDAEHLELQFCSVESFLKRSNEEVRQDLDIL